MMIRIKVGEVEIEYHKETEPDTYNAATCVAGYSKSADQGQLLDTVRELVLQAKELHEGLYIG